MPPTTAVWEQWERDVPAFTGKSDVLELLLPMLGPKNPEGRTVRGWFQSIDQPPLPNPRSRDNIVGPEVQRLRDAADSLLPITADIHFTCREKAALVSDILAALPGVDRRDVSTWSGSHGSGYDRRARRIRAQVIHALDTDKTLRLAVLGGERFPIQQLRAFDDVARELCIMEYLDRRGRHQWIAAIPQDLILSHIGNRDLTCDEVRAAADRHLRAAHDSARREQRESAGAQGVERYRPVGVLLPTDLNHFVDRLVSLTVDEKSFTPPVELLWRSWVDHGTEWIENELRHRLDPVRDSRLWQLASTETYDTITDGVLRFLTRVDLGLQLTDEARFRTWARKRVKKVVGGALQGSRHGSPHTPHDARVSAQEGRTEGAPAQSLIDMVVDQVRRGVLRAPVETPGVLTDEQLAAVVDWLDTQGSAALLDIFKSLDDTDAPQAGRGGHASLLAEACHHDLAETGRGPELRAVKPVFALGIAEGRPKWVEEDDE